MTGKEKELAGNKNWNGFLREHDQKQAGLVKAYMEYSPQMRLMMLEGIEKAHKDADTLMGQIVGTYARFGYAAIAAIAEQREAAEAEEETGEKK